ncbi:YchF/TatD family DNA exonuclease [Thalassomonas viridans]|uniref:YchF/TatD family DNA exonuclease n=1 Tax=Thalassomonas viridans TaxID=137584 RepID=A0AAF0CCW3_9GAMM|nr:YchF/TatD family DNA exonuclease [Thalassomonas viridans]WDE07634.1 YchF/TatD family DNA exonuclease [Thalassomonas viridans]
MFIDSHCHLDRLDLSEFDNNLDNVVEAAGQAGVHELLCVSVTLKDFPAMAEKTRDYANVRLSCGAHPLNQEEAVDEQELLTLAQHERVIAVGETGLDYFYAPETKALQLDAFKKHVRVARKIGKPLIIHTRDAREDTLNILREEQAGDVGGILHCFTESWEMAEQAMEMGFYISFSGIVTFKNASALREVAKKVPDDRFLIETDAPYLAPVPHRGKQNQPAYVVEVARHLASIRGQSVDDIARLSSENYRRLFPL